MKIVPKPEIPLMTWGKVTTPGHAVALFYGFVPLDPIVPEKADENIAKRVLEGTGISRSKDIPFHISLEEKISLLRMLQEREVHRMQLPFMAHMIGRNEETKQSYIDLDIVGTSKSIAEAILIKTAIAILNEEGFSDLELSVNSIGDRDSLFRYARELATHYRRNHDKLHPPCKQTIRRDVFELLYCTHDKCVEVRNDAPKSISFLTEPSRQHFKEVLEYLEMFDMPYRIHHPLIGNRSFCSHTVFELREIGGDPKSEPLAVGIRYDYLGRRLGFKREMPSSGVRVFLKAAPKLIKPSKVIKPKLSFFHLGYEARLKSLSVLEMLRKANLPVFHSLSREKLGSQISAAQPLETPYALIMGQKEALEHTVIVRNSYTREQESVPIPNLVSYLETRI